MLLVSYLLNVCYLITIYGASEIFDSDKILGIPLLSYHKTYENMVAGVFFLIYLALKVALL